MFRMLAAAALTLALTVPAMATETMKPEKPKKVAKICKDGAFTTGSRMRAPRTCKTQAQWDAAESAGDKLGVSNKGFKQGVGTGGGGTTGPGGV